MHTIHIYDRALCCATGICGPQVDPVLPQFAADLEWLKAEGHHVERYNLGQQPLLFVQNKTIHELLTKHGTDCLPVVLVDGQIVSQAHYPTREMFARWLGVTLAPSLPVAVAGGCCESSDCC